MKMNSVRGILFAILLIITTNCSSKKSSVPVETAMIFDATIHDSLNEEENLQVHLFERSRPERKWIDSIYNQLTLEEKIGQLFMIAAYSNKDSAHIKSIDKLVQESKIGGLIFFQGGPERQARLTNRYQSKATTPLLIGIDAEWGLSMRLDSTYRYPWNMSLGAIRNTKLLEKTGEQMAEQAKRLGVHFTFAPVLDININPKNPIIGSRSFGEDKENVTNGALALMIGLQKHGVFATGKHFPGHGDTETDSHYTLPVINASKDRIEDVELYPYKKLFKNGLASVMVAHLEVPSYESRKGYPSSISKNIVTDLLQKELGFKGLIFTDALNMKGASNFKKPGDIDLEAFIAGNDVLLFPENVPIAIQKIKEALDSSKVSYNRLETSVKKILHYKYKAGLNHYKPIPSTNLYHDLNAVKYDVLQNELYENIVTVVKNDAEILPIRELENQRIAYVKMGEDSNKKFVETLKSYADVTEVSHTNLDSLKLLLAQYSKVIIGFHKSDGAWKKHDFTEKEIQWITEIAKTNTVILDVFTRPYALSAIPTFDNIKGMLVSYQNNDFAQSVSAQIIFGALGAKGRLSVSINDQYKVNHGLITSSINRLGFSVPERVGMKSSVLVQIDEVVNKAISSKMIPGAQVLVARKGQVVYQKSFGYHTYDKKVPVQNTDIYDVASVTKIASTLPNVMQIYEQGKVTMTSTLGEMMPEFKGSNKQEINFKDLLSHYARLQAWIPFYKNTLDSKNLPKLEYYQPTFSEKFSKKVAEDLYIRNDYADTIFKIIIDSELSAKKEYKYSDFTFIILKKYIEKVTGKSLDKLSFDNFYNSLGASYTLYNPLNKFSKNVIPPTEDDTYFRYQRIQGNVHDMAAAMEGGVSGHAGLFSNAIDLAKIMQLYLQKGNYGDKQYFSEDTFNAFNTCYFCPEGNRRGLGFDKPQLSGSGPTCGCASLTSFGHTGFTGTMVWADPENEIIYVFLSNRTFPDSNAPNALSKNNVRENIQKIIYESISN
jgi:beta-N-acetylhexosaminidase